MTDKKLKDIFIDKFLKSAYANMEMEDEVNEPYNKKKLYERYKVTVDSMIEQ
jgi:hypothetical protein